MVLKTAGISVAVRRCFILHVLMQDTFIRLCWMNWTCVFFQIPFQRDASAWLFHGPQVWGAPGCSVTSALCLCLFGWDLPVPPHTRCGCSPGAWQKWRNTKVSNVWRPIHNNSKMTWHANWQKNASLPRTFLCWSVGIHYLNVWCLSLQKFALCKSLTFYLLFIIFFIKF